MSRNRNNILTRLDSYKASHYLQYPPATHTVYDYICARGGEFPYSVFFGLQMLLPKLSEGFTKTDIEEVEEDFQLHGEPFNRAGWEYILNTHGGLLPLRIKAVPEGGLLPIKDKNGQHIPLVTVENTDPECFWLPGYLETQLLRGVWYPTTVCTNSFASKVTILKARMKSCDDPFAGLEFALHDFQGRGVSSAETAELSGAAHMVNFMGTDTFECFRPLRQIYGAKLGPKWMPGFSVPAAEHSTITSWRRGSITNEANAYDNMLIQFAEKHKFGIIAVVSDSYDLWNAIDHVWGGELREKVKTCGATIVVRPDSGDPLTVPVKAVSRLADRFGFTVNSKGYKVLPSCIRVIQGDGVNRHSIAQILDNLLAAGFSAENLVFGMGGALGQKLDRDTMEWAMKASAIKDAYGNWWDVYKSPIDQPNKHSMRGRFALISEAGEYETVPLNGNEDRDILQTVWENGEQLVTWSFDDIRARANIAATAMASL